MSAGERPSAAAPTPELRLGGGLTGRMLLASGMLLVVLGASFGFLLVTVTDLRTSARAARDSEGVLAAANELERLVVDLETGVRGFVLTGEEQFLQPWRAALANLPARTAELEQLSAGNAEQARTARKIAQSASSYVEQYATPLIDAARRGDRAAKGVEATAEGKRRVDAIRADFDAFIATEGRLAQARQQRAEAAASRAVLAVLVGVVLALLLVLVFTWYLAGAIVRPVMRAAQMAVRLAGGDLATRMPATGVAEIGQLEGAFNEMAASLERGRGELAASRARVVASADETRRRIERDLHDGSQQRLVSLALQLRAAQAAVPTDLEELAAELDRLAAGLNGALDELREFARGIHPAILAEGGLGPALRTLARRSAVPVELDVRTQGRLPRPVEVGAYYVVSEALANSAKHAHASTVAVDVEAADGVLRVSVRDDGVGGADLARGSGLVGLKDRVEALGGRISVASPRGAGTALQVELPLDDVGGSSG